MHSQSSPLLNLNPHPEAEGREKIEGLETKTKYLKSPPHDTDLPILKKKIRYW
jgi:hypothetical protein